MQVASRSRTREPGTVAAGRIPTGDAGHTSPDVIREAWRKYKQSGDIKARNQLVLHYAPVVKFAVGRLRSNVPSHLEEADLLGYGMFGLMDAIERFDHSFGVKFETYASSRIRGAVLDELRAVDWVPRSVRSKASAIEHAQGRLRGELRRNPEDSEIATALGTSKRALDRAREEIMHSNVIALDQLNVYDGAEAPASTVVMGDPAYDPLESFERHETTRILIRAIDRLSERERLVMTRYYFDGLTLAQIADDLHVTESRVCQIHTKALRRLRERAAAWGLTTDEARLELCAIA